MGYLFVDNIKCPNCNYKGKAQAVGSGCGSYLIALTLFLISWFLFWPLLIVAILYTLWIMFRYSPEICPKCKWEHPIPVKNNIFS
jgi:hypothetical protein